MPMGYYAASRGITSRARGLVGPLEELFLEPAGAETKHADDALGNETVGNIQSRSTLHS